MRQLKAVLFILVFALALMPDAGSAYAAPRGHRQSPGPEPRYDQSGLGHIDAPNVTTNGAAKIALAQAGGGTVARIETKYPKHGGMEYKVIIVSGIYKYDVHVDAYAGTVRSMKMDQVSTVGSKAYYNTVGTIGADRAKSIAIERAGGGVVTKCKLDNKSHEGLVYKINVANGQMEYKIELYATTGSIYKFKSKYKS